MTAIRRTGYLIPWISIPTYKSFRTYNLCLAMPGKNAE